jgi:hypothetical protein
MFLWPNVFSKEVITMPIAFSDLTIGSLFRFPGGVSVWLKLDEYSFRLWEKDREKVFFCSAWELVMIQPNIRFVDEWVQS